MAIYFDRNFNKALRGYNTEEVDAALDAIVIHCNELEEANREFAEENNRLIDGNSLFKNEIERLKRELSENLSKLQKVEETYNIYRQKYGEAKDMLERAKKSSFDIISEANERSSQLISEAQIQADKLLSDAKAKEEAETAAAKAERNAVISELDREIAKKNELIHKLESDLGEFKDAIRNDIAMIMARLDIKEREIPEQIEAFPAPKNSLPDFDIEEVEEINSETLTSQEMPNADLIRQPTIIPDQNDAPTAFEGVEAISETPDLIEDLTLDFPDITIEAPTVDAPVFDFGQSQAIPIQPISSVINEVQRPDTEFSKIKNTLDGINNKVKNNKSTPYMN